MQYLKEDVKDRILLSALEEFKNKGFIDASMRDIAHNAEVALGNVYRYFKNKEDLFDEMVGPVYDQFMNFIFQIQKVDETYINPSGHINNIQNKIMEIFKDNSVELLILMDKSKGTKYQSIKEDLILIIEEIINKTLIKELINNGVEIKDQYITYVLSSILVQGGCVILRKNADGEKTRYLIDQLVNVLFLDIRERL